MCPRYDHERGTYDAPWYVSRGLSVMRVSNESPWNGSKSRQEAITLQQALEEG